MFIDYGCVIYRWKAHEKEISKSKKKIYSTLPTSCFTQKSVPAPKVGKNGYLLGITLSPV